MSKRYNKPSDPTKGPKYISGLYRIGHIAQKGRPTIQVSKMDTLDKVIHFRDIARQNRTEALAIFPEVIQTGLVHRLDRKAVRRLARFHKVLKGAFAP